MDELRFTHRVNPRSWRHAWRHTFEIRQANPYEDFDANSAQMNVVTEWCRSEFGLSGVWTRDTWETFGFNNDDQAMTFKLRWC